MRFKFIKSKFKRNSFASNLLVTTLGSSTAYIIGLLFTPVISRIYGPEAYGAFSVFNALVANFSLLASLGYEQAVILPSKRKDFYALIKLNFIIVLLFSTVLLLFLLFIPKSILLFLNLSELQNWIYFLPILIFLNVISQVMTTTGVKYKKFINASSSRIFSVLGAKGYALGHGVFHLPNVGGFIIGEISGKLVFILGLLKDKNIRKAVLFSIIRIDLISARKIAKIYKKYPLFNLPGVWLSMLTMQLPTYGLLLFFGTKNVGYFSMASMLMFVPLNLFARSMGTVFIEKASTLYNEKKVSELKRISLKMSLNMAFLSILPIALILTLGEQIFTILLGPEWAISGVFAKFLCLYLFSELIAFPLGTLFRVLRIEKTYLTFSLLALLSTILILLIASQFNSIHIFVFSIAVARFIENGFKIILVLKKLQTLQN